MATGYQAYMPQKTFMSGKNTIMNNAAMRQVILPFANVQPECLLVDFSRSIYGFGRNLISGIKRSPQRLCPFSGSEGGFHGVAIIDLTQAGISYS